MLNPLQPGGKLPPSSGKNKTSSGDRMPTLAECLTLAGGNHFVATVLQKICHYCAHPRFKIAEQMYSAPTTRRLAEELGMSEATVNKAIRMLRETEVIETVAGRFNRSPRRYIRLLKNPATFASTLSGGGDDEPNTLSDQTVAPSLSGAVAPSLAHTVHLKKEKKKKKQIDELGPEQGPLSPEIGAGSPKVACYPPFSGEEYQERGAAPPLWPSNGIMEKLVMGSVRSNAAKEACDLEEQLLRKPGWDAERVRQWQVGFVNRRLREFLRKRAIECARSREKVETALASRHPLG
jgi:DNA-binding Lrp family transcriptional regulator